MKSNYLIRTLMLWVLVNPCILFSQTSLADSSAGSNGCKQSPNICSVDVLDNCSGETSFSDDVLPQFSNDSALSSISGPQTVCVGQLVEYCIDTEPGVFLYNWFWGGIGESFGTISDIGFNEDSTQTCVNINVESAGLGELLVIIEDNGTILKDHFMVIESSESDTLAFFEIQNICDPSGVYIGANGQVYTESGFYHYTVDSELSECTVNHVDLLLTIEPVDPPVFTHPIEGDSLVCVGSSVEYCIDTGENVSECIWSWDEGEIGTITPTGFNADSSKWCMQVSVEEYGTAILKVEGMDLCWQEDINPIAEYLQISSSGDSAPSFVDTIICEGDIIQWGCHSSIDSAGVYECTYSNIFGCDSTHNLNVSVIAPPVALFEHIQLLDGSIQFDNNSEGANSYYWNFGDGNSSSELAPIHFYEESGTYEVQLIVSNSCSSDTLLNTVSIITVSSLNNDLLYEGINIYPNPTTDVFVLESSFIPGSAFDVRLYDLHGRSLYHSSFTQDREVLLEQINLSEFAAGIYYLEVKSHNQKITKRVIKL